MRADLPRFDLEDLVSPRHAGVIDRRPPGGPGFLVQVPDLVSVAAHCHDYYELGVVLDGSVQHVVNGTSTVLGPGAAFLLSTVDVHELRIPSRSTVRCLNVLLAPAFAEATLDTLLPGADPLLPWLVRELSEESFSDVERLREVTLGRPLGWSVSTESLLRLLLVQLAASAGSRRRSEAAPPGTSPVPEPVREAVRFLDRHFREPLTLSRVAAIAHLSPQWFSEQFRVATGESFQARLKRRRLQFARALLAATDQSVTEVSRAAGFNSLSHFGRAYRERYGEAPSALRPSPARLDERVRADVLTKPGGRDDASAQEAKRFACG